MNFPISNSKMRKERLSQSSEFTDRLFLYGIVKDLRVGLVLVMSISWLWDINMLFLVAWTRGWERGKDWDGAKRAIDDDKVLVRGQNQDVLLVKREFTAINKAWVFGFHNVGYKMLKEKMYLLIYY